MQLSDLAELRRETVQPSEFGKYTKYIGYEDIAPNSLMVTSWGNTDGLTSGKLVFREGDTIYGRLRPYFRKAVWSGCNYGICSSDFWVIKPLPGVDPRFLFYVVAQPDFSEFASSSSTGTRMPRAQWDVTAAFRIPVFAFEEQRRIAGVLGALDDKIESNRQIANLCDALAIEIFGQAAVEHRQLGDIAKVRMGSSPPGTSYNENGEGIAFFQGVRDFSTLHPVARVFTNAPKRLADAGDILFSVRAPVGRLNIAHAPCCIGRGLAAITADLPSICFYALRAAASEWEKFSGEGTVFGSVNQKALNTTPIPWPGRADEEHLDRRIQALIATMSHREIESIKLAELRDALLPELMSGRMRVDEAGRLVSEAIDEEMRDV